MSEDRFDNEEKKNDVFANNTGVIKSWKGLILVVGGFSGYLALLVVLSTIPSLRWLTPALVGLLFLVMGIIFLNLSKVNYIAPLFAALIGAVLLFFCIADKFFPDFLDEMGDKGIGIITMTFGLIMLLYPYAATLYYKCRYKVTVEATVAYVDYRISRTTRGYHARTYRPVYEFTYSGKVYQVSDKLYTSGSHPVQGEERELLIDENRPEHFFDAERMESKSLSKYFFPVVFLALGLYLFLKG